MTRPSCFAAVQPVTDVLHIDTGTAVKTASPGKMHPRKKASTSHHERLVQVDDYDVPASSEEEADDLDLGSSGDDGEGLDEDSALFGSAGSAPASAERTGLGLTSKTVPTCVSRQHAVANINNAGASMFAVLPSRWCFHPHGLVHAAAISRRPRRASARRSDLGSKRQRSSELEADARHGQHHFGSIQQGTSWK